MNSMGKFLNRSRGIFAILGALSIAGCGGGGGQVVGPGVTGDGLVHTSGNVTIVMLDESERINLKETAGQQSAGSQQTEVVLDGIAAILPVVSNNPSETQEPCLYMPPQSIFDSVVLPVGSVLRYFNTDGSSGRTLQASVPLSTDGKMTKGLIISEGRYQSPGRHEFIVTGNQFQPIEFRNDGDDDFVLVPKVTVKFDINADCQTSIPKSVNLVLPIMGASSAGASASLTFDSAANGQTCTFNIVGSIRSTQSGLEVSNGQVHIVGTGDAGIFGGIEEVIIETSLP